MQRLHISGAHLASLLVQVPGYKSNPQQAQGHNNRQKWFGQIVRDSDALAHVWLLVIESCLWVKMMVPKPPINQPKIPHVYE